MKQNVLGGFVGFDKGSKYSITAILLEASLDATVERRERERKRKKKRKKNKFCNFF